MGMMNLQQVLDFICQSVPQARLVGDGATPVARVHTDTRTLQPGDLFVALKGERFDANAFLADARDAGAVAAVAHGGLEAAGLPGIEVPDSLAALGALATAWRAQFSLPLIGITGSNGKTTVTQMVASILRAWKGDAAFATQGNFNNDIGVPLTLLRLRAEHAAAVIEMGMNHPGEIATLAAIAQPTVALVNNAQREHLEFMHTVQAVAEENGSVLAALPADGVAVFPAGDAYTGLWARLAAPRRCITFGAGGDVQCGRASWEQGKWQVEMTTPVGALSCTLQIAGLHNVTNALAAAACAVAAGVSLDAIARGLTAFSPVKGRSRALSVRHAGRDITVVDDTYNANPESVHAAIDVLSDLPGPHILVLGDMGEVGHQGATFHAEAGRYAKAKGIEKLLTLGDLAQVAANAFDRAQHFDTMERLIDVLLDALPHARSVLVKGSRFMRMERAVQAMEPMAIKPATQQEAPHAP